MPKKKNNIDSPAKDEYVDTQPLDDLKKWHKASGDTADEFIKAFERSQHSLNPDVIRKANKYRDAYYKATDKKKKDKSGFKSDLSTEIINDIYSKNNQQQLGAKSQINFRKLRRSAKHSMIQAIIRTRKSQLMPFMRPSESIYEPGFQVKRVEKYYSYNYKPILSERLTKFLMNCGDDEYYKHERDRFQDFMMKIVDDSLTLDQGVFEIQFSKMTGRPCCFIHVPAESIEIIPKDMRAAYKQKGYTEYPKYVQIINGHPRTFFYDWELGFGVRNHDTAVDSLGYGNSEVENLYTYIYNMYLFEEFNMSNFKNGAIPKGVLVVEGDGQTGETLAESTMSKLQGAWNNGHVPVMQAPEKVQYLALQQNVRDLEYGDYFKLILNVVCANFKISPEEIGFRTESGYQAAQSVRGQQSEKEHSLSKGLRPLLEHIASWINEKIIYPKTDGEYQFCFTGMDKEVMFNLMDTVSKATQTFITANEGREMMSRYLGDLKPMPEGDIIVNSVLSQEKANIMTQLSGGNPYVENAGEEDMGENKAPVESSTNTSSSKSKNNLKNSGKDANDRKKQIKTKEAMGTKMK